MSGVHPTPSTGRPGGRSISPTQLRAMWRSASQERGWSHPDDWWCPAVDAVTEAIVTDGDVAERCSRLGQARARAGVSMAETLDDVVAIARLTRALQSHPSHSFETPPEQVDIVDLLKSVATGWAEATDGGAGVPEQLQSTSVSAPEALPGLGYLAIRLREAAAEAESEGARLGERYALVVAALLGPPGRSRDPLAVQARLEAWDRVWQMSQVADDLHAVFVSGESIVRAGPSTAVVLARRTPQLVNRVAKLRALLDSRAGGRSQAGDRSRPGRQVAGGGAAFSDGAGAGTAGSTSAGTAGSTSAGTAGSATAGSGPADPGASGITGDPPKVRIWVERLPDNLNHAVQLLGDLRR